ncbi:MAG: hypothetical protein LM560_04005 [Desulfurococcaceae archaeon]|jgi:hypothetical protein|nr:hypothetical protein [Desulfurococcaceae archaeon]
MDVLTLTVLTTGLMLLVGLIILISYLIVRRESSSKSGLEAYLCGESMDDFKNHISLGSSNLYWGSVSAVLKKFYDVLRDKIHTGILNDWLVFMSLWFFIAVIISFIVVFVGG